MQIVIDIPQHLYDLIKKFPSDSNEGTVENVLVKSVEHGTPIPEGHGRLIDADDFFDEFSEIAVEPYINALTVLKADNETKEHI